jgi:hypothetical protein
MKIKSYLKSNIHPRHIPNVELSSFVVLKRPKMRHHLLKGALSIGFMFTIVILGFSMRSNVYAFEQDDAVWVHAIELAKTLYQSEKFIIEEDDYFEDLDVYERLLELSPFIHFLNQSIEFNTSKKERTVSYDIQSEEGIQTYQKSLLLQSKTLVKYNVALSNSLLGEGIQYAEDKEKGIDIKFYQGEQVLLISYKLSDKSLVIDWKGQTIRTHFPFDRFETTTLTIENDRFSGTFIVSRNIIDQSTRIDFELSAYEVTSGSIFLEQNSQTNIQVAKILSYGQLERRVRFQV